jgi:lipoprotein-releasing system permease protein
MNTELFISKRLFFDKSNQQILSKKIIRIALFGIALGLAVMIVSVAVITGFKTEIRNKVIGFGSHIQIINFESGNSYENNPVSKNQPFLNDLKKTYGVKAYNFFATKAGIIKTDEVNQGVIFKGVESGYDWAFFKVNLVSGDIPNLNDSARTNEILISENLSRMLRLNAGDQGILYFINKDEITPRMLQFKVCGIYRTNLEEFDNLFVIGDIKQIQRINDWQTDEITGIEIEVSDFGKIDLIEREVRNLVINYSHENSAILRTENITRQYPQIFDWLSILDMNVWVILFLMVMVAGFNMISALLVLILERSTMIGVLKSLGSPNRSIRKVFLYLSVFLTSRGMLWGNVIGIAIILIQKIFQIIKLNPATYYVDVVPVNFNIMHILLLNAGRLLVTTFMLVIPSYLVSKISPDKSIRFD